MALIVTVGCGVVAKVAVPATTSVKVQLPHKAKAPAARTKPKATGSEVLPLLARPRFDASGLRSIPPLGLHARSAFLVDLGSNQVLWEQEPELRRAPASLTKLMTAVVALDVATMDTPVTVGSEAATVEATRIGLEQGETLTVRELLYGMLLPSANDAAEALAAGLLPRDAFLQAMNDKARNLAMRHTHFSTPTGLDDPQLYTTAADLAVLGAYIEGNYPVIAEIAATRSYEIRGSDRHKWYTPLNRNRMIEIYPGANGLKTGFTGDAGGCIMVTATRGDRHLLAVLLGSDVVFADTVRLLDYGFSA